MSTRMPIKTKPELAQAFRVLPEQLSAIHLPDGDLVLIVEPGKGSDPYVTVRFEYREHRRNLVDIPDVRKN